MKKLITVVIISLTILCGCEQNMTPAPIVTLTVTPSELPISTATLIPRLRNTETPWPTLIYYLYPTITPNPNRTLLPPKPTITAPATRFSKENLPNNLSIEEYKITLEETESIISLVHARHPNKGGWYFWPKGGMINGKSFQATEKAISYKYAEIHATLDGKEIFVIDCGQPKPNIPAVITAWTYENHWIIQSVCHQEFDVFWDGISLNKSKDYQSSFAFQLMDKKPFYLFKRNGQVWLFYEGKEILLGYDEIKLTDISYQPPQHYENMITFYAIKNERLYYVAIGKE